MSAAGRGPGGTLQGAAGGGGRGPGVQLGTPCLRFTVFLPVLDTSTPV